MNATQNTTARRVLTLAALAARYEVSITPVREAVRRLVEDGVLLKHENGRIEVNPRRLGTAKREVTPPAPPTDWERVITEEVMRERIVTEEY